VPDEPSLREYFDQVAGENAKQAIAQFDVAPEIARAAAVMARRPEGAAELVRAA
jgi:hypothetical protein